MKTKITLKKSEWVLLLASMSIVIFGLAFLSDRESKLEPMPEYTTENQVNGLDTSSATTTTILRPIPAPSPFKAGMTSTEKKQTLLKLIAGPKPVLLTSVQKTYILQEFGGTKTAGYNFTATELNTLIDTLNRNRR